MGGGGLIGCGGGGGCADPSPPIALRGAGSALAPLGGGAPSHAGSNCRARRLDASESSSWISRMESTAGGGLMKTPPPFLTSQSARRPAGPNVDMSEGCAPAAPAHTASVGGVAPTVAPTRCARPTARSKPLARVATPSAAGGAGSLGAAAAATSLLSLGSTGDASSVDGSDGSDSDTVSGTVPEGSAGGGLPVSALSGVSVPALSGASVPWVPVMPRVAPSVTFRVIWRLSVFSSVLPRQSTGGASPTSGERSDERWIGTNLTTSSTRGTVALTSCRRTRGGRER